MWVRYRVSIVINSSTSIDYHGVLLMVVITTDNRLNFILSANGISLRGFVYWPIVSHT